MMRPSRRILGSSVLASVLGLVLAASTLAASSFTYKLSGFEIAATSTVGTFVGVARAADDVGAVEIDQFCGVSQLGLFDEHIAGLEVAVHDIHIVQNFQAVRHCFQ